MSGDDRTFVIIGASMAGGKAAETLREEGFAGKVVLVGEEIQPPYERPPLSKGYLAGRDRQTQAYLHEPRWWADRRIDLLLGRRATMLDPVAHTVTLDGVERLGYDKLLLATGSRVRTLDVPGHDLRNVRYLRTMDEAEALRDQLARGVRRLVVVGAGWIGLEVAAAAVGYGAEVTVVELGEQPLGRVLGDQVGAIFRDLHASHGVTFRLRTGVRAFRGEDAVEAVVLDDDTELPADLVVIGAGIRPATELAVAANLAVSDGIVTDSALRTSDPDIYACGDVARWPSTVAGQPIRVEHWANAHDGGPAAARSMLGQEVVYDAMPFFFTDQYDLGMEFSGWFAPGGYDRVVFRGDPALVNGEVPEFLVFWLDGSSRVLAGMNVNIWDVADQIQALIRSRRPVDPARLADPSVSLDQLR